jgi:hypothetical protein
MCVSSGTVSPSIWASDQDRPGLRAVPQTAVLHVVTRSYSSGAPNFAAHSPEDSEANTTEHSIGVLAQVRVCCDTSQEASVVDALASFGVVHADMPVTLANIWLAIQGPACSEGPARQCLP